jgi:hypothetical protein
MESAVFLPRYLPPGSLITLFSMGAITGAIFLPFAILILRKYRPDPNASAPNTRLVMPTREWIWKFAVIAIAYVIVYYTFGYFVAWKDPAVQAYYGGTDPGNFFAQLGSIWATTPWMFFFQAARGMLWALFTLPVIRMYRGSTLGVAIVTGCLLAVWVAMLLIPNPLMPDAVRRAHIWETAPSNFIFGWFIGWLLTREPRRTHLQALGTLIVIVTAIGCHAPTATPAPTLTQSNADRTLASLRRVDDHPLYTMQYYGAYARAASRDNDWARANDDPTWACSLFAAFADPHNRFYGRNFDWEPSPALLVFTHPPNGYASVAMVDIAYLGFTGARANKLDELPIADRRALLNAPSLPFDGMNARGLVVGMAAVPPSDLPRDPGKRTIGSLRVIREMLDRASNVSEAIAVIQNYNIDFTGGPPVHYLIADRAGQSAVIEFYRGAMRVIPNQQATNFLQSAVEHPAGQCWRYDAITRRLAQVEDRMDARGAMNLLREVAQTHTEWSVVYGISTGEINVAMGRRYDRIHTFQLTISQ